MTQGSISVKQERSQRISRMMGKELLRTVQVPREQYSRLEGEDRGYKEAHIWLEGGGGGGGFGHGKRIGYLCCCLGRNYIKNLLETVGGNSVEITQNIEKKRNRIIVIILWYYVIYSNIFVDLTTNWGGELYKRKQLRKQKIVASEEGDWGTEKDESRPACFLFILLSI